jgi:hypothetical protein
LSKFRTNDVICAIRGIVNYLYFLVHRQNAYVFFGQKKFRTRGVIQLNSNVAELTPEGAASFW